VTGWQQRRLRKYSDRGRVPVTVGPWEGTLAHLLGPDVDATHRRLVQSRLNHDYLKRPDELRAWTAVSVVRFVNPDAQLGAAPIDSWYFKNGA
jgi:hypothetical protein